MAILASIELARKALQYSIASSSAIEASIVGILSSIKTFNCSF